MRQVHFTIDTRWIGPAKNCQHQPNTVTEEANSFIDKAQHSQLKKSKEGQKQNQTPQLRANAFLRTSVSVRQEHDDIADLDIQDHWVKNLSDWDLNPPENDILAKGLNFSKTAARNIELRA